jgi:hypothetical protein
MVEQDVYSRIKTLADGRVYPTIPTENSQLPLVVYTVTSTEPQINTQGSSNLIQGTLDVDVWGIDLDTVLGILGECNTALHLYRSDSVQGCFLKSQSTTQEETGFHGIQSYTIWVSE